MIAASGRNGQRQRHLSGGGEPEAPPPYKEPSPPASPTHTQSGQTSSSVPTRASAGGRSYPRRVSKAPSAGEASLNRHYSAVLEALESPPVDLPSTDQGELPSHSKPRRGTPLVQWVWPSNATTSSVISKAGSESNNSNSGALNGGGRNRCSQENEKMMMPGLHQRRGTREAPPKLSGVVTGKVCEPVRPTRLDLSASQGKKQRQRHRVGSE